MKWLMSNIFHSYVHRRGSDQPSIDSGAPLGNGQFSLRQGSAPKHPGLLGNKWSGTDDGQSCQGCQMHLKVSRGQAHCSQGGATLGFRWDIPFTAVHRMSPVKDLTPQQAHQDNMKDAGASALVFVKIARVTSLLATFAFSFCSLCLISF